MTILNFFITRKPTITCVCTYKIFVCGASAVGQRCRHQVHQDLATAVSVASPGQRYIANVFSSMPLWYSKFFDPMYNNEIIISMRTTLSAVDLISWVHLKPSLSPYLRLRGSMLAQGYSWMSIIWTPINRTFPLSQLFSPVPFLSWILISSKNDPWNLYWNCLLDKFVLLLSLKSVPLIAFLLCTKCTVLKQKNFFKCNEHWIPRDWSDRLIFFLLLIGNAKVWE